MSSDECKVRLDTKLSKKKAGTGETVRFTAELKNLTDEGLPMTMAILGIPAGLSPQPWQLKEMMEKNTVGKLKDRCLRNQCLREFNSFVIFHIIHS